MQIKDTVYKLAGHEECVFFMEVCLHYINWILVRGGGGGFEVHGKKLDMIVYNNDSILL